MRVYLLYISVCIFMVGTLILCLTSSEIGIVTAIFLMMAAVVSTTFLLCFELRQGSVNPERQTLMPLEIGRPISTLSN